MEYGGPDRATANRHTVTHHGDRPRTGPLSVAEHHVHTDLQLVIQVVLSLVVVFVALGFLVMYAHH